MQRRQFLGLVGFLATPFELLADNRKPTPEDVEGPFYPVVPIPMQSNLVRVSDKLIGEPITLAGRVLDRHGKPVNNVKVEIWQSDGQGIYQHPSQEGNERFDTHFDGFGAQLTNEQGYYNFTTLYPVPYNGRPPHIHVKLWQNGGALLTTQLYLEGKTGGGWFKSQREQLQIAPKREANGALKAEFTFIV